MHCYFSSSLIVLWLSLIYSLSLRLLIFLVLLLSIHYQLHKTKHSHSKHPPNPSAFLALNTLRFIWERLKTLFSVKKPLLRDQRPTAAWKRMKLPLYFFFRKLWYLITVRALPNINLGSIFAMRNFFFSYSFLRLKFKK